MNREVDSHDGLVASESASIESAERNAEQILDRNQVAYASNADLKTSMGIAQEPSDRPNYIYAIGEVEPRFPDLSVEREFAQVAGRRDTQGLSDRMTLRAVFSDRSNRYLVRQCCWVFSIQRLATYLILPKDPADLDLLIESLEPDLMSVVIGVRGPLSRPDSCNGLVLPVVAFDQLYSFTRDELISQIPLPDHIEPQEEAQKSFRNTSTEMLGRLSQIADNMGAIDDHRALNYLAVRYPAIYAQAAEAQANEKSLSSVDVRQSRLGGLHAVVDVIFSYSHRRTGVVSRHFVRVDVSGEFPFIVTKLQPYYEP